MFAGMTTAAISEEEGLIMVWFFMKIIPNDDFYILYKLLFPSHTCIAASILQRNVTSLGSGMSQVPIRHDQPGTWP